MNIVDKYILGKECEFEESTEPRTIELNDLSANAIFVNKVSPTKYNFATSLPKFLSSQNMPIYSFYSLL